MVFWTDFFILPLRTSSHFFRTSVDLHVVVFTHATYFCDSGHSHMKSWFGAASSAASGLCVQLAQPSPTQRWLSVLGEGRISEISSWTCVLKRKKKKIQELSSDFTRPSKHAGNVQTFYFWLSNGSLPGSSWNDHLVFLSWKTTETSRGSVGSTQTRGKQKVELWEVSVCSSATVSQQSQSHSALHGLNFILTLMCLKQITTHI